MINARTLLALAFAAAPSSPCWPQAAPPPEAAASTANGSAAGTTVTLKVVDDKNFYDQRVVRAKPGQTIKLTLVNDASAPDALHNWVLVKPDTDKRVALDGVAAGEEAGYVPDSPNVLAHTKLLKQGESQTVTFQAPKAPGTYPFLCTYPGHEKTMRGKLIVK